jgi:hypothetical protein
MQELPHPYYWPAFNVTITVTGNSSALEPASFVNDSLTESAALSR